MTNTGKKRLNALKNKQQLLYLMLFSLATVIIWVTISLITSQKRPGISPELQKLAAPLTPTLNQDTLRKIEQKRFYSDADLANFPIYKVITSSNGIDERIVTIETAEEDIFPTAPTPSPTPTPSISPEVSPTPSVTPSPATGSSVSESSTGSGTLN